MAEAFRLGKIRKILMPVFQLRQSSLVGPWGLDLRSRRSSGAGTPSAGGLSNFRRLILRVRPAAKCQVARGHTRNSELSGAMLKARAIGYASG
jgi:hypothetical protein